MGQSAQINGQSIWFEDSGGDGPAVILSHGFLMDHEMFEHQVAALSPEFRVITWDERGFGQTVHDGNPFSYWDSARDCLALMDHLGLDSAVLGGMSQGGFLSLRAALLAPERVRALVLLDTASDTDDEATLAGYRQLVDAWLTVGPIDDITDIIAAIIIADPAENPRWVAKWKARPPEAMKDPSECLLSRDDITARLGEITCPAIVVHGTADTAISMDRARALAAGLSGAGPVVEIEGGAHSSNLTHPDLVNPPLLEFLRRVSA